MLVHEYINFFWSQKGCKACITHQLTPSASLLTVRDHAPEGIKVYRRKKYRGISGNVTQGQNEGIGGNVLCNNLLSQQVCACVRCCEWERGYLFGSEEGREVGIISGWTWRGGLLSAVTVLPFLAYLFLFLLLPKLISHLYLLGCE